MLKELGSYWIKGADIKDLQIKPSIPASVPVLVSPSPQRSFSSSSIQPPRIDRDLDLTPTVDRSVRVSHANIPLPVGNENCLKMGGGLDAIRNLAQGLPDPSSLGPAVHRIAGKVCRCFSSCVLINADNLGAFPIIDRNLSCDSGETVTVSTTSGRGCKESSRNAVEQTHKKKEKRNAKNRTRDGRLCNQDFCHLFFFHF
jgi:hypothetical protein